VSALLDHIKTELAVLKQAPFTFAFLLIFGILAGIGIGSWHYDEQLTAKDGQLSRYRVALGIDPASKGALVELNNQELSLKAQPIVVGLRQLSAELERKELAIRQRVVSGELDKQKANQEKIAAMREVSRDFDGSLASDAYNVEHELRKRLSPEAMAHVIKVPAFIGDGDPNSRIIVSDIFRGSGPDALMIGRLADEIEQMAKLLPPDSR
jgi:hypothetical protein